MNKRRISLATKILIGFGLGIGVGLFLGELASPLGVVGTAFLMLLQMTVLPYLVVSLIAALGRLTTDDVKGLAKGVGFVLVALWALALMTVLLSPLALPTREAGAFFSTTLVGQRQPFDFLALYIPTNPFRVLADSVVPAAVVFCVALGVALTGVEGKRPLLDGLNALSTALGHIAEFVVRLAPWQTSCAGAGQQPRDSQPKVWGYLAADGSLKADDACLQTWI